MTQDELFALLGLSFPSLNFSFDSITEDSRRVRPETLFVAVEGVKSDGHAFAEAAVAAGASAVLGNRRDITQVLGRPYLHYENPRRASGIIAHALAGNPSHRQCVIGITGTNGKTSTACLVQRILTLSFGCCANLGTLGYDLGGKTEEAPHTTPFGEDLARMFSSAEAQGCKYVVMEVSSHALEQERVAGIEFNVAAFTNLTQDHLDYHQNMESYLQAKLRLFEKVRETMEANSRGKTCFGVVNLEDPCADRFMAILPQHCRTYGDGGDVRAEALVLRDDGASFHLVSPWGEAEAHIRLVGRHNVLNALCAASIAAGLGIPLDKVISSLDALPSVPGRFEPVTAGQPFQVIVDYAHTDDGLRNALLAARAVCSGKIILVFGCGGDRDKGKRPKMGAVAAELADYSILTSDNPRTEEPCRILLDIEVGMQRHGKRKGEDYLVIESRKDAISEGIRMAKPGDMVLIAGKGHETYQITGTERRHFDDREEAMAVLKGLNL